MTKATYMCVSSYKNCFWYCSQCIGMAERLNDIAGRLQTLETMMKDYASVMKVQQSTISNLESKLSEKCANNQFFTPMTSVSVSKKRKYNDVVSSWADEMRTPVTTTSAIRDKKTRGTKKLSGLFKDKSDYEPILVIESSDSSKVSDVLSEVKKVVNPRDDPVKVIRQTSRGNVILECNDQVSVTTVKNKLNAIGGSVFSARLPKQVQPEIKLVGLNEFLDQADILTQLKSQNPDVISESSTVVIRDVKKIVTRSSTYYTVYIQTDCDTFEKIMSRGKLCVMWSRLRCYQVLPDSRCYKCHKFDHIADKCPLGDNVKICPKCSGSHDGKECDSSEYKCINCVRKNEKYGIDMPVNHCVWSYQCPIYKHRQDKLRRNVRYVQ